MTITVRYPSAQQFYRLYGAAFENRFPHIRVQVLREDATGGEDAADVIVLHGVHEYVKAVGEGRLLPLYALSKGKETDFEKQAPLAAELIRSAATDGQLYAVAPAFHGEVLYYNIDLFDEHGIPHPTDGMSWSDLFALARRFPDRGTDGRELYGLQLNFYRQVPLNTILKAGETRQLSYLEPSTLQVVMNTDEWKAIWDAAVPAFRAGVIYDKALDDNDRDHPPFYTQNAAMMIASSSAAYDFASFSAFADVPPVNWGMVTAPVDPERPDYAPVYSIHEFFGVSAASDKAAQAFELIQFIATDPDNSRRLAAMHPNRGLPAVLEHLAPIPGHDDLSAFYKLNPLPLEPDPYQLTDPEIIDAFKEVAQFYLDQAMAGNLSTEEALAAIETEGQAAIGRKAEEQRRQREGD